MSMNILLIEEDEDLHTAIVDFLEERRFGVTPCWSYMEAEKALARIPDRSRAPDAIVSDADGLAFFIKARGRFPGIRWIVTAARQPVAEPGNPMTSPVELRAASDGEVEVSPRLADRFIPGAGQPT
jgi:DNA-binding NtrC family response regulator